MMQKSYCFTDKVGVVTTNCSRSLSLHLLSQFEPFSHKSYCRLIHFGTLSEEAGFWDAASHPQSFLDRKRKYSSLSGAEPKRQKTPSLTPNIRHQHFRDPQTPTIDKFFFPSTTSSPLTATRD